MMMVPMWAYRHGKIHFLEPKSMGHDLVAGKAQVLLDFGASGSSYSGSRCSSGADISYFST
jgi:hypothetical protein